MSDFEEHNMGAYIASLKATIDRLEGETPRWRDSFRTLEAERDEYKRQAHLYHADMMKVREQRDQALARETESNREFWRVSGERDRLRDLLKSGFAYVRDAKQLLAAEGDLDEEDEDGANEWLESAAAALTGP